MGRLPAARRARRYAFVAQGVGPDIGGCPLEVPPKESYDDELGRKVRERG